MASYTSNWRGFDRGREGWLEPENWIGLLEILSKFEGESIRNPQSPLYVRLKEYDPSTQWVSEEDSAHNFFRDYQTPWTLTGVLQPTRETQGQIILTDLGRMLAMGRVSQRAVMVQAMATYEETSGENSFAILARAFLKLKGKGLTLPQIYHCIATSWRPGDSELRIKNRDSCSDVPDATRKRRLRSILKMMSWYGALIFDGETWSAGDEQLLSAISRGNEYPEPEITAEESGSNEVIVDSLEQLDQILDDSIAETIKEADGDAIKRVLREISVRRGQSKFRKQLLRLYRSSCAVTKWDAEVTLEAAHILPVANEGSNDITNGILLRSDIHTLFDLNCLSIDPTCWQVRLSPLIAGTKYAPLQGREISLPASLADFPSSKRLYDHMQNLRSA